MSDSNQLEDRNEDQNRSKLPEIPLPNIVGGLGLDAIAIKKAGLIIRSINHKLRLAILKLLSESEKLTVTEIYVKLRLEQSVASQHLAILRRAGFVDTIRDGKNIHYVLNNNKLNALQQIINQLLKGNY